MMDEDDKEEVVRVKNLSERLVMRALAMDGTCTGEHGIGVEKIHFMKRMFSEDDLAVMGRLRDSFNPNNKLSPDKMLPTAGACGMEQTHPGRRAAM